RIRPMQCREQCSRQQRRRYRLLQRRQQTICQKRIQPHLLQHAKCKISHELPWLAQVRRHSLQHPPKQSCAANRRARRRKKHHCSPRRRPKIVRAPSHRLRRVSPCRISIILSTLSNNFSISASDASSGARNSFKSKSGNPRFVIRAGSNSRSFAEGTAPIAAISSNTVRFSASVNSSASSNPANSTRVTGFSSTEHNSRSVFLSNSSCSAIPPAISPPSPQSTFFSAPSILPTPPLSTATRFVLLLMLSWFFPGLR